MAFNLDVVSIHKKVFSGDVDEVQLPSVSGVLTVLANHMALVTVLKKGVVIVKIGSNREEYEIGKGVFSFAENKASLMIEDVKASEEESQKAVKQASDKAENISKK